MKVSALLPLFALLRPVLGQATTRSSIRCQTEYNTVSVSPVPTGTTTKITQQTATVMKTTSPVHTVTSNAVVSYITVTSSRTATLSTKVQASTSTSTLILIRKSTVTIPVTGTSTVWVKTVTQTPTVVVQPSAGFTPIKSSAAKLGTVARRHARGYGNERPVDLDLQPAKRATATESICRPPVFSASVACTKNVNIISTQTTTIKATKTTTVTAVPMTVYSSQVLIRFTTKTIYPRSASRTITSTRTETLLSTITSRVTKTIPATATVVLPAVTSYAACASSNVLSSLNGIKVQMLGVDSDDGIHWTDITSNAYDCCVSCVTDNTCAGSAFGTYNGTGQCYRFHFKSNVCSANRLAGEFYTDDDTDTETYQVMNGNCGHFGFGSCLASTCLSS